MMWDALVRKLEDCTLTVLKPRDKFQMFNLDNAEKIGFTDFIQKKK